MTLYLELCDKSLSPFYEQCVHHQGDVGIDITVPTDVTVPAGGKVFIDLGDKAALVVDGEAQPYLLYPRSSISKRNLVMMNGVGVIDAGYRGTLIMAVWNLSTAAVEVKRGERLCQVCSPQLKCMAVKVIPSLSVLGDTTRRGEGFGSTGL